MNRTFCIRFILAILAIVSLGTDAFADATGDTTSAISYCQTLIPGSGVAFVAPMVSCFTDPDQGIIPTFTTVFLSVSQTYYVPIVQVLLTLMVVIYGIQLVTGHVEEVKSTTFTLIFKVAGVFYFMSNAPTLYQDGIAILDSLIVIVSNAAASISTSGCVAAANLTASGSGTADSTQVASLWGIWDCVFGAIFGFSAGYVPGAIASFLLLVAASKGVGLLIAIIALYFLAGLFFSCMRFIHIYIIAVLGLSFFFCIGYIFVPLILFKGTMEYFTRWLNLVISLIMTPVIALGYMAIMLVALDMTVFNGPISIWTAVNAGNTTASTTGGPADAFGPATALSNVADNFKNIFYIDYGNSSTSQSTNATNTNTTTGSTDNGGTNGNECENLDPSGSNAATNTTAATNATYVPADGGVTGKVYTRQENVPGTQYIKNAPAFGSSFGIPLKALQQACANQNNYNLNLLVSFAGAALLVYVMYSLLNYIPSLAGDLVSQGARLSAASMFGSRGMVPGQQGAKEALGAVAGKGAGAGLAQQFGQEMGL